MDRQACLQMIFVMLIVLLIGKLIYDFIFHWLDKILDYKINRKVKKLTKVFHNSLIKKISLMYNDLAFIGVLFSDMCEHSVGGNVKTLENNIDTSKAIRKLILEFVADKKNTYQLFDTLLGCYKKIYKEYTDKIHELEDEYDYNSHAVPEYVQNLKVQYKKYMDELTRITDDSFDKLQEIIDIMIDIIDNKYLSLSDIVKDSQSLFCWISATVDGIIDLIGDMNH